ncbi:hypothetical protein ACDH53_24980 [Pseudomonas tremae]|uniref:Cthe-2314-like HEPN domain-containing protein n=1 Tax=Pseudomonas tremae TaxID=200454 RepID=A0ABV4PKL0_9PSED|nr:MULTISPECIES: hypothetical protein [Pseudomonas syringae group]RMS45720.1 hypothetical protein ALP71_200236 [Pseudomonas coronafaciens pv. garcae]
MDSDNGKWGYRAGPSDSMKKEIGQIAVNHALFEPPLMRLFQHYTEIPEAKSFILAKSLGLRGNALLRAVKDFANHKTKTTQPVTDAPVLERLNGCLKDYEELSKIRNEVAHWQWYPSPDGAEYANAACDIRKDSEGKQIIKKFTLENLQSLALNLIFTSSNLELIADLIIGRAPQHTVIAKFKQFDEIAEKVRAALPSLPEPSVDALS